MIFLPLFVAIAFAGPPELPQEFEADVTITMPIIPFPINGHMFYDFPNQTQRIDQRQFTMAIKEIDRYDQSIQYLIVTFMGQTVCKTCYLQPPLYPFWIPSFAEYVGEDIIKGHPCAHWTARTGIAPFVMVMDFWISEANKPYIVRTMFTEDFTGFEIQFDFDNLLAYSIPRAVFQPNITCTPPVCNAEVDIILLVDGSGSITAADFRKMKSFCTAIAENFTLKADVGHMGVIQFSSTVKVATDLSGDSGKVLGAISSMTQLGSATNTAAGLTACGVDFTNFGRKGAPQAVVLLTDGRSSEGTPDPVVAAQALKDLGIQIFCVGIGDIDPVQLKAIASQPLDTHYFEVKDFDGLNKVLNALVSNTCIDDTCDIEMGANLPRPSTIASLAALRAVAVRLV